MRAKESIAVKKESKTEEKESISIEFGVGRGYSRKVGVLWGGRIARWRTLPLPLPPLCMLKVRTLSAYSGLGTKDPAGRS